jgi:hypothetical protein
MSRYSDPEDDYRYFHEKIEDQAARIAELEAKLERCIKLAAFALENEDSVSDVWDWAKGCSWHCDEWQEIVAEVRAAIETPEPR